MPFERRPPADPRSLCPIPAARRSGGRYPSKLDQLPVHRQHGLGLGLSHSALERFQVYGIVGREAGRGKGSCFLLPCHHATPFRSFTRTAPVRSFCIRPFFCILLQQGIENVPRTPPFPGRLARLVPELGPSRISCKFRYKHPCGPATGYRCHRFIFPSAFSRRCTGLRANRAIFHLRDPGESLHRNRQPPWCTPFWRPRRYRD
jgi:hypothetical protein